MGDVALRGTQINVGTHEPDLRCILKFSAKSIQINSTREGKILCERSHNITKTSVHSFINSALYGP